MEPNAVVELRNVSIYHTRDSFKEASFRKKRDNCDLVLSDVNLTVRPGELVYRPRRVGQKFADENPVRRTAAGRRRRVGRRLRLDQNPTQGHPVPSPAHGHRFPGLPAADRSQCIPESAVRTESHRMEERHGDQKQNRRSAQRSRVGQQGV